MKKQHHHRTVALVALVATFAVTPAYAQLQNPSNDFVLSNQDLVVKDSSGRVRARVDATTGDVRIYDTKGGVVHHSQGSNVWLGGHGKDGDLVLLPNDATSHATNQATIHLNGAEASGDFGGPGRAGVVVVRDANDVQSVGLLGDTGEVVAGQVGTAGAVLVRDGDGDVNGRIDGAGARVELGSSGAGGDLVLRDDTNVTTVVASANASLFELGTASRPGFMTVAPTITLDGQVGDLTVGTRSVPGDVDLVSSAGNVELSLSASNRRLAVGGTGAGTMFVRDGNSDDVITVDGAESRIRVGGIGENTEVHHDGIRFSDGTFQSSAEARGPRGPRGPRGAPGPRGEVLTSSAVCVDGDSSGSALGCGAICSGTFDQASSPCSVQSQTGSCSAGSYWEGAFENAGRCCVCH